MKGCKLSEFIKADAELLWKIPEAVSWEEAAALGGVGPGAFAAREVQPVHTKPPVRKPRHGVLCPLCDPQPRSPYGTFGNPRGLPRVGRCNFRWSL